MSKYIYFTPEEKARAQNTDLVSLLRTQGERPVRSGREFRTPNDPSITVRGNKWFDHSKREGGYAVSFVQRYYAEDLSHREKTVYIYLRDRADASGVCWPGIKTIAGELGLSPRTVQRALADLEHRQLIEKRQRHRPNGSLTSNLYRLTAAKKSQPPAKGGL